MTQSHGNNYLVKTFEKGQALELYSMWKFWKKKKMTVLLLDSEWRQKLQAESIFEKDKDMSLNMQLAQYKLIAEVQ